MFESVLTVSRMRRSFDPSRAKTVREQALLSQADVAQALGVRPSAVSRWENGERMPRGDVARAYAEMLDALAREVA